jgi:hypothetical protein
MRARRSGHVVNIISVGAMVSVPHLLLYTCARFAAGGEPGQKGIYVTTVMPDLRPAQGGVAVHPAGHFPAQDWYARRQCPLSCLEVGQVESLANPGTSRPAIEQKYSTRGRLRRGVFRHGCLCRDA